MEMGKEWNEDANKDPLGNGGVVEASFFVYNKKRFTGASYATPSGVPVILYDAHINELKRTVEEHDKMLAQLVRNPIIIPIKIYNLPSEKYELNMPVDVILEMYPDEVLALLPDLTLCGEGENELEALEDLKSDIIDLLEYLEDVPETDLGKSPKLWKKTLGLMVKKCQ